MPAEIYEIVAQGARYWFLFLMALIVWRSYRWYRRDQKQRKKRLRLLPDAGYIGEMVVLAGGGALKPGAVLPVPREGTLGYSRGNDLCVPVRGVEKRHTRFRFETGTGLSLEPYFGKTVVVDGQRRTGRRNPLAMGHGSRLTVGDAELRLRLFAGFEAPAPLASPGAEEPERGGQANAAQAPAMTPEQFALWQQQAMQQQALQMAYLQWMAQGGQSAAGAQAAGAQMAGAQAAGNPPGYAPGYAPDNENMYAEDDPEVADEDGGFHGSFYPPEDADGSPSAYERQHHNSFRDAPSGASDDPAPSVGMEPYAASSPRFSRTEFDTRDAFYPPEAADGEDWPYASAPQEGQPDAPEDDDLTDAAAPPKSAYVGHDEAEAAKRRFWDRYLGGGERP